MKRIVAPILLVASALAYSTAIGDGWPPEGVPIGWSPISYGLVSSDLFPDGSGGVRFVWLMKQVHDMPWGPAFHNRVAADGYYPGDYRPDGLHSPDSAGTTYLSHGAGDGAGGAWVVWWMSDRLQRQHVDAGGHPVAGEPDTGIVLRTGAPPQAAFDGLERIAGLGADGFVLVWPEFKGIGGIADRLVAQKYDAAGAAQWPVTAGETGLLITPIYTAAVTLRDAVPDGSGGVVVAWTRAGTGGGLVAQRVQSGGTLAWTSSGRAITTYQISTFGDLLADGAGGAYLAWWRAGAGGTGCAYVQHVTAGGVKEWTPAQATGPDEPSYSVPRLALGLGPESTIVVAWPDNGSYPDVAPSVRGQKLDAWGTALWGDYSVTLADSTSSLYPMSLAVEDDGEVWVSWGTDSAFVRRFGADGAALAPTQTLAADGEPVGMVKDAGHPPIAVFTDMYGWVRALRLESPTTGVTGSPLADHLALAARANPARGARRLAFTLPVAGDAALDVFDVGGRSVATRCFTYAGAGTHEVTLAEAAGWPPGLFFARLRSAGGSATLRLVHLGR